MLATHRIVSRRAPMTLTTPMRMFLTLGLCAYAHAAHADLAKDAPESKDYKLVYDLTLPEKASFHTAPPKYAADNSKTLSGAFSRVAYFMELQKTGQPRPRICSTTTAENMRKSTKLNTKSPTSNWERSSTKKAVRTAEATTARSTSMLTAGM